MNSTPEIEIHRSPCTVSSGRVTGRTGSPPAVPRGIRAESSCQSGIASDIGVPAAASAETPVIAADAGFQRRTTPARSTRKTPSPTCVSTMFASERASTSSCNRELSRASAIIPATARPQGRSVPSYGAARSPATSVSAPSARRPPEASGRRMWVAESSGRRFRITSPTAGSGSGSGSVAADVGSAPATAYRVTLPSSASTSTTHHSARARVASFATSPTVEQIPLDRERPARLVQDRDGLFPHPDDAPVAREHAVAQAGGLRRVHGVPLGEDLVPVVRVDEPGEEAGIREPLVGGIADQPVDLGADEGHLAALEGPDVGDDRQVLPQRAVGRPGVAKLAGEPSNLPDVSGDDDRLGRVRARDRRDRGSEEVAFTAPLLAYLVQPLAFADGFGDTVRLLFPEQVGDWAADDLVGLIAVQRLGARAPV